MVAGLVIASIPASAYAWTYSLTGSGTCQKDGSFSITWNVDNSRESQDMNITYSSNPTVVAVSTKIPAKKSSNFTQTVNGTKAGSYSLTLKSNWPSDQNQQIHSATVSLAHACDQPATRAIESGSTSVTTTTAPAPAPVTAAQVVAPKGAVNAGSVDNDNKLASVLGLSGSAAIFGLGLRRLIKSER